jgi:putative endonuclease
MSPTLSLGRWGEQLAEAHFKRAGADVLARNFRCDDGEIDLIVLLDGELVAIEVKTRNILDMAAPEEAVRRRQLRRIANALSLAAEDLKMTEMHWRIDVVAIRVFPNGTLDRLAHVANVFP